MRIAFLFLAVLLTVSHSRVKKEYGDKLISILARPLKKDKLALSDGNREKDKNDAMLAKSKAKILLRARDVERNLNDVGDIADKFLTNEKKGKEVYRIDPVLNVLRRSRKKPKTRRWRNDEDYSNMTESTSSSREMQDWKYEWNEQWLKKKLEALNTTSHKGDFVNMVAARPWGVPCGDPNQHDMPWGTCMLAAECDGEYRIYRGDRFCGRTHFVCCALQLNMYDMNQGFDVSFADSSLQTDSAEKRDRLLGSREKRRRRKARERRRRKRDREQRKRRIKRKIKKIVREVQRILNKSYRNATTVRRKKTKTLKKFIKYLKKKYRADRDTVKDIHEIQLIRIDYNLMQKLKQISEVNKKFMANDTFRKIVLQGEMSYNGARMLVEAYPDLAGEIKLDKTRRSGGKKPPEDYLNYDVEYGMLYY